MHLCDISHVQHAAVTLHANYRVDFRWMNINDIEQYVLQWHRHFQHNEVEVHPLHCRKIYRES